MFKKKNQGAIAVLHISGRISDVSALEVFSALREVAWEKLGVRALILRICSEGGSIAAAQSIYESLDVLRDEMGLRIVSVVEDIAVSAAFFLAVGAERVFATPAATVGAVGAVMGTVDLVELGSRLGVAYHEVKSGPQKAYLTPYNPRTEEGERALQQMVDDVYVQFQDWIVARRKVQQLPVELLDGRMYTARRAAQAGLVDHLWGMAAALQYLSLELGLAQANLVQIETRRAQPGLLQNLIGSLPFGKLLLRLLSAGG